MRASCSIAARPHSVTAAGCAILSATVEINRRLGNRYYMPLRTSDTDPSLSEADVVTLRDWTSAGARTILYNYRGVHEDDELGEALRAEWNRVLTDVDLYATIGHKLKLDAEQLPASATQGGRAALVGVPCSSFAWVHP